LQSHIRDVGLQDLTPFGASAGLPQLVFAGAALAERMSLVRRPRGQVDCRLGIRGEHDERLAGAELGEPALRQRQRERAGEAARVQGLHNAIVAEKQPRYALAVIVATDDPMRLYAGLSVLASTAAEGSRCAALASFRGLELLVAADLERRAAETGDGLFGPAGRDTFARSLVELRDTVLALDTIDVFACSASSETMLSEPSLPVLSTPRFLRETAGARLLFV
jgi:hypothetical protein